MRSRALPAACGGYLSGLHIVCTPQSVSEWVRRAAGGTSVWREISLKDCATLSGGFKSSPVSPVSPVSTRFGNFSNQLGDVTVASISIFCGTLQGHPCLPTGSQGLGKAANASWDAWQPHAPSAMARAHPVSAAPLNFH